MEQVQQKEKRQEQLKKKLHGRVEKNNVIGKEIQKKILKCCEEFIENDIDGKIDFPEEDIWMFQVGENKGILLSTNGDIYIGEVNVFNSEVGKELRKQGFGVLYEKESGKEYHGFFKDNAKDSYGYVYEYNLRRGEYVGQYVENRHSKERVLEQAAAEAAKKALEQANWSEPFFDTKKILVPEELSKEKEEAKYNLQLIQGYKLLGGILGLLGGALLAAALLTPLGIALGLAKGGFLVFSTLYLVVGLGMAALSIREEKECKNTMPVQCHFFRKREKFPTRSLSISSQSRMQKVQSGLRESQGRSSRK